MSELPPSDSLSRHRRWATDAHQRADAVVIAPEELLDLVECAEALLGLYKDQLDYIRLNHLCGAEDNHWMVASREALEKLEAL